MRRALIALALTAALLAAPAAARAESDPSAPPPDTIAMLVDLVLIRPVSVAAVVAGAVLYLPAAWVTSWGDNDLRPIEEAFLERPAEFAFKRPLGRFEIFDFEGANK